MRTSIKSLCQGDYGTLEVNVCASYLVPIDPTQWLDPYVGVGPVIPPVGFRRWNYVPGILPGMPSPGHISVEPPITPIDPSVRKPRPTYPTPTRPGSRL